MPYGREYRLGGRTRIRHDARTLTIRGKDSPDKKEHGRYVKCWKCGFICDTERDDLGGAQSRAGDGAEFYYDNYPQSTGSDRGVVATLSLYEEGLNYGSGLSTGRILQEDGYLLLLEDGSTALGMDQIRDVDLGGDLTLASYSMRRGHRRGMAICADGTADPVKLTYASKVTGGCPFCGTRNYRGDFR